MHHEISTKTATAIGFSAILMWGTLPSIATFLGDVPPFVINSMAFSVAFIITMLKWAFSGQGGFVSQFKSNFTLNSKIWILGLFGIFGYHFIYFLAYRHSPPLITVIVINIWPLLTVLFSCMILGYALKANHLLGGMLGLFGVGFISLRNGFSGIGMEPLQLQGYGEALLCAVIWSLFSVLCRKWASEMKADSVGVFCGLAALLSFICHLAFEAEIVLSAKQIALIIFMGVFPMGIAFFTWDYGMKHGNVRTIGLLSYCGPLIGISLLLMLDLAQFSSEVAIATCLILSGAFIGTFDFARLKLKAREV